MNRILALILAFLALFVLFILLKYVLVVDMGKLSPEEKAKYQAYRDSVRRRNDSINTAILDEFLEQQRRTDSIKAAEEYQASLKWQKKYYVDEFGDITNKGFIKTMAEGTFSNSAINNGYLYVEMFIDKNSAGLFLHEYSRNDPAEIFIGGGEMKLKNQAGEILTITNFSKWNNSGGMSIGAYSYIDERLKLVNFLKRSVGEIKVSVRDKYSSTYSFIIDAAGFTEAYNSL